MMNYRQGLLFVGKCLTLDQNPKRIAEIKATIAENTFPWGKVVRLSSNQLVLPAMFLQLKRNGLIDEMPADLAAYLEELTNLNRERNLAILNQVKEITSVLNAHHIYPLYLKGVAHLLIGIYNDPAERMIGDIDFVVARDKMEKAAEILIEKGYQPLSAFHPEMLSEMKHYPRLCNLKYPAAVEIHKEVIDFPHCKLLSGEEMLKEKLKVISMQQEAFVPSARNLILHNVYNAQINDKAFLFGDVLLRQMYDLTLLALKNDLVKTAKDHGKKFNMFNTWFALASIVFSSPNGINYQRTWRTWVFIQRFEFFLTFPAVHRIYKTFIYILSRIMRYIILPLRAIIRKEVRRSIAHRLANPKWYGAHLRSYIDFFRQQ